MRAVQRSCSTPTRRSARGGGVEGAPLATVGTALGTTINDTINDTISIGALVVTLAAAPRTSSLTAWAGRPPIQPLPRKLPPHTPRGSLSAPRGPPPTPLGPFPTPRDRPPPTPRDAPPTTPSSLRAHERRRRLTPPAARLLEGLPLLAARLGCGGGARGRAGGRAGGRRSHPHRKSLDGAPPPTERA